MRGGGLFDGCWCSSRLCFSFLAVVLSMLSTRDSSDGIDYKEPFSSIFILVVE